MRFPLSLYVSMTGYLLKNMMTGRKVFPLVLMLEPTHRCNLSCAGCGRIREYHDTLDHEMSLEDCLQAVDESGPPVVTITGGEPLLYSRVDELVRAVLARGRHIYFCTNGLLLEDNLHRFRPSSHFTWNVHFDGTETVHDEISAVGAASRKRWPPSVPQRSEVFASAPTPPSIGKPMWMIWRRFSPS
jgi:hopanoid biosynthesis associated radical SAM protein HpnH